MWMLSVFLPSIHNTTHNKNVIIIKKQKRREKEEAVIIIIHQRVMITSVDQPKQPTDRPTVLNVKHFFFG